MFLQICIDTWTLLLSTYGFVNRKDLDTVKRCARWIYVVFFLALRLLWAMCKEKQFVKFDLSFTTLYATIAWLENGVI